jgi:hypothetical protein
MLYTERVKIKLKSKNMNSQLLRRIAIILGYLLFFGLVGFLIHLLISPKETCLDGKKNQSETGVDCGGVCSPCKVSSVGKDLVIGEKTFVPAGNNTFDLVVRVSNPNDTIGVASFHFVAKLQDADGNVVATKEGNDYLLPADSKYVIGLGLRAQNNVAPTQVEFAISQVSWSQLSNLEKPQLNVYNKKFGPESSGVGSRAEGLVRNESSKDFKKINLVVVLRDDSGSVLGVSTTQQDNVRAGQEAGFILTWPYAFPKAVRSMEVEAQTNVYDSQNFSAGL